MPIQKRGCSLHLSILFCQVLSLCVVIMCISVFCNFLSMYSALSGWDTTFASLEPRYQFPRQSSTIREKSLCDIRKKASGAITKRKSDSKHAYFAIATQEHAQQRMPLKINDVKNKPKFILMLVITQIQFSTMFFLPYKNNMYLDLVDFSHYTFGGKSAARIITYLYRDGYSVPRTNKQNKTCVCTRTATVRVYQTSLYKLL